MKKIYLLATMLLFMAGFTTANAQLYMVGHPGRMDN